MRTTKASSTRLTKVVIGAAVVVALVTVGAYAGAQAGDVNAPAPGGPVPWSGAASPTENSFVPVTPCRLVNTQNSAGKFGAGETRNYRTQGNTSPQGGAADCGVPSTATAIEVAITAVSSEGNGYVRVHPAGSPLPNATFLSFTGSFNVGNAGTVAIRPTTGTNLAVKVYQQPTHLVIDVLGYYVPELFAIVTATGGYVRGNGVTSTGKIPAVNGAYEVLFNRNVTGCTFVATPGNGGGGDPVHGTIGTAARGGVPHGVFVDIKNAAGERINAGFHLVVDC